MAEKIPTPRNPLPIISTLIGAIEAIFGGTAVGIGPGFLQVFLVISMVLIFAGVSIGFFYVLIKSPGHFYNPGEFPRGILPFSGKESEKERNMARTDPRGGLKPKSPSP